MGMIRQFTKKLLSIPDKIAGNKKDFFAGLSTEHQNIAADYSTLKNISVDTKFDCRARARAIFIMFIYFPTTQDIEKKRHLFEATNQLYAKKYRNSENPYPLGEISPNDPNLFDPKAESLLRILKIYALQFAKNEAFSPLLRARALALLLLITPNKIADKNFNKELSQVFKSIELFPSFIPPLILQDSTIGYLVSRKIFLENN